MKSFDSEDLGKIENKNNTRDFVLVLGKTGLHYYICQIECLNEGEGIQGKLKKSCWKS